MDRRHLKLLVETGDYRPEPALIAQAMLRRRGVRELLIGARSASNEVPPNDGLPGGGGGPLSSTGRSRSSAQAPRQAA